MFSYFNSSCASFGISKLTEHELQQISNKPDYKNMFTENLRYKVDIQITFTTKIMQDCQDFPLLN